jgi:hypothetical protein
MKARGVVRITPADVGSRVSVRALIPAAPGEPTMTDTVGVLEAWVDGRLRIRRRDGAVADVDESALIAGRTISAEVPSPDAKRG